MTRKDLCGRIEQNTCPPRIVYSAECESGTSRRFSCTVKLDGATTMETGEEVFFNISAKVQHPFTTPTRMYHYGQEEGVVEESKLW